MHATKRGQKSDKLFEEAQKLQAQLQSAKSSPFSPSLQDPRAKFCILVEKLFVSDIELASRHSLDQVLWKLVFYGRIDGIRRELRQWAGTAQKGSTEMERNHGKEKVKQAQGILSAVINEARSFYDGLITTLQATFALSLDGPLGQSTWDGSTTEVKAAYIACQKCYVLRGDIERYAEQHGHSKDKNFELARSFYLQARAIYPSDGNPHNQLAVVANLDGAIVDALFHYCAALACRTPFRTSGGNLNMLYEKARTLVNKEGFNAEVDECIAMKSVPMKSSKSVWTIVNDVFGPLFVLTHKSLDNTEQCSTLLSTLLSLLRDDPYLETWLLKIAACLVFKVTMSSDADALAFMFRMMTVIAKDKHAAVLCIVLEWIAGIRGNDKLSSLKNDEFWSAVLDTMSVPPMPIDDEVVSGFLPFTLNESFVPSDDCYERLAAPLRLLPSIVDACDEGFRIRGEDDEMEDEIILFQPSQPTQKEEEEEEEEDLAFLVTPLPDANDITWDVPAGQEQRSESDVDLLRVTQLSQLPAYPFASKDMLEGESGSVYSSWSTGWPVIPQSDHQHINHMNEQKGTWTSNPFVKWNK